MGTRNCVLIVVMGVSGCGKTTVGSRLAKKLGYAFADADNFHSQENREKMRAGIPLCDADRVSWLVDLNHLLLQWWEERTSGVLACSALKSQYRTTLVNGSSAQRVQFVHLSGPKELIAKRLEKRKNHFMSPQLLESQLNDMECPDEAICVSIEKPPDWIVKEILKKIAN